METNPTTQARKVVRVVAKVKPTTDPSTQASTKSISVTKPNGDESDTVTISFGAQFAGSKDSYKLDYCYEENESLSVILAKEIKPLISTVFEGKDANVIAHGARCSGKTHFIQGSEREHGLAILTMTEILSMAEERGDSVSVSIYEVSSQETVYDILDKGKRVVSVLEGAQGKIQLKGLSKVIVKSLSEFQDLYFGIKKVQKLSHKGVMIHVGSLGRMNYLDLAGYEDSRKQNSDVAPLETTRINKSIYALQNVLYALNANEFHVPYRESKLTRMLKDCLKGSNRTLLITCLPREFSQDSFYMLNLASRICVGSNRAIPNATKKNTGPLRSISSSSTAAIRRQTPLVVSAASKRQTGLQGSITERRIRLNTASSTIKGRKLFTEGNDSVKPKVNPKKMEGKARVALKKGITTSKTVLKVKVSSSEEEVCSSLTVTTCHSSSVQEEILAPAISSSAVVEEPVRNLDVESIDISTINQDIPLEYEDGFSEAIDSDNAIAAQVVEADDNHSAIKQDLTPVNEGVTLDKENNSLLANETASPPLSLRLQELSNTLKSLCKSSALEKYQTTLAKSHVEEAEVSERSDITAEDDFTTIELRTPEKSMSSNIGVSPWKAFSAHSSKLKNSAVGEYLKFLNTADKEDLKKLKGIGEKRATYIVELRDESPEPFKTLDDMKEIGLSEKQIKGMLRKEIGVLFD